MIVMKRKIKIRLLAVVAVVAVAFAAIWCWARYVSPTSIAFVNYNILTLGQISKANDNSFIKICEVSPDDIGSIDGYDMVFVNGMGLRITEEQREAMIRAANGGTPVLTTAATNPDNYVVSVDSLQEADIRKYLANGGRRNYRSMLNYVRRNIDRKLVATGNVEAVRQASDDMIYHASMAGDDDDAGFNSVAEYDAFLKSNKLMGDSSAPRIVICGQMGDPTDLVARFESTGSVVYPVRDIVEFVRGHHIDSVNPSAVVNMAHGRLGDDMVDYLTDRNIPLFSPLNVNRLHDDWRADKSGMNGGFMSQSIVMPEIDGALRPYALFAHRINDEGLQELYAMPDRLESFVANVNNYISLKRKPNSQKRVAIFYFKGPGQSALVASGMEVLPSLYNVLLKLKAEGYDVAGLPQSEREFEKIVMERGPVFGTYAEGQISEFISSGHAEMVSASDYRDWVRKAVPGDKYVEVTASYGEFPGSFMAVDSCLAVARIRFGNIVLLPQPAVGVGDNEFQMVYGTDAAPPHSYIAPYLWCRYDFGADALIHFGTHGSLEYTPRKQVALGSDDWSDCLIGELPHMYVYTIGNVGEALIAKRRSYAGIQSHLTPPFIESNVRGTYRQLMESVKHYNHLLEEGANASDESIDSAAADVRRHTQSLGIHRDLAIDSSTTYVYTSDDVARVEQFAEELASEKITGKPYVMGEPYEADRIQSSVYSMATDPIAYGLLALDKLRGAAVADVERHKSMFTQRYLDKARLLVGRLLANPSLATDAFICDVASITADELKAARGIEAQRSEPNDMMSMMMRGRVGSAMPVNQQRKHAEMKEKMAAVSKYMSPEKAMAMAKMMGADDAALRKMRAAMAGATEADDTVKTASPGYAAEAYSKDDLNKAMAIMDIERAVKNVGDYRALLTESPQRELESLLNALDGGFTPPSPGGDPIVNPNTLPTGRNLYGVNAEATPSESAWEKGRMLAENTIEMYRRRHGDSIPRKVSYTLWSGEFVETEGATVAQVLYMLGVEPIRDAFGRVTDLRLIPSKELGRPRIDVVVQTSGQLRDIAASRLFLINRAVEMAASAADDEYFNNVAEGAVASERILLEKGLSPKEAREISTYRVFGGVNGNYGTGIQGMVQSGDKWTDESEIASVYLANMGAFYGSEADWEGVKKYAFEAALANTDAVVQPRQSNSWGALSLDHVYEFMGGLNLAVRNVTGKDPDAYMSDYRNHHNMRMQEVKEAIGVESRTTIFNPSYIREKMKGGASSAGEFAAVVENTYGWNVMKPDAIDNEMWNEIYDVYVKDKMGLGVRSFFESVNPAALQDISAVMMECARKGMWKATESQLHDIAMLHAELIEAYGASGSAVVADNALLRKFIASKLDGERAGKYDLAISKVREAAVSSSNAVVMNRQELSAGAEQEAENVSNGAFVAVCAIVALFLLLIIMCRCRRKKHTC